jgi:hypothetical protein
LFSLCSVADHNGNESHFDFIIAKGDTSANRLRRPQLMIRSYSRSVSLQFILPSQCPASALGEMNQLRSHLRRDEHAINDGFSLRQRVSKNFRSHRPLKAFGIETRKSLTTSFPCAYEPHRFLMLA